MILVFEVDLVMIPCGYIKWVWSSMGVAVKDRSVDICVIIRDGEIIKDVCVHEGVWLPEVGDLLLSRSKDT